MGLSSFFASLRGSKAKENVALAPSRLKEHATTAANPTNKRANGEHGLTPSCAASASATPPAPNAPVASDSKEKRKRESLGLTLSRSKSQTRPKNRRSWFGGQADDDEDLPPVPKLTLSRAREAAAPVQHQHQLQQSESKHPLHDVQSESKAKPSHSRHFSLGRSRSRKREQADKKSRRRSNRSWFSTTDAPSVDEPLPPLPPMPITIVQPGHPLTATLPVRKRRSRAGSTNSLKKVHSHWFSNPDESESDTPPVPALARDMSPEGSGTSSSFDDIDLARTHAIPRKGPRMTESKQSRPLSVSSRKTYVTKSTATGILASTHGPAENPRHSYRCSFKLDEGADWLCLNEEQQAEWTRLMDKAAQVESRAARQRQSFATEKGGRKGKFANAEALAALEFGLRM